jgi:hypothetical protein
LRKNPTTRGAGAVLDLLERALAERTRWDECPGLYVVQRHGSGLKLAELRVPERLWAIVPTPMVPAVLARTGLLRLPSRDLVAVALSAPAGQPHGASPCARSRSGPFPRRAPRARTGAASWGFPHGSSAASTRRRPRAPAFPAQLVNSAPRPNDPLSEVAPGGSVIEIPSPGCLVLR